MRKRMPGFSLIEVVVSLAVLAIIVTMGVPALASTLEKSRLSAATEAVYTQLQFARSEVMVRNRNIYAAFQTGDNWCIGLDGEASCDCSTHNDCTIEGITHALGYTDYAGVSLITNFSNNDTGFTRPRLTAMDNGTVTLTSIGNAYESKIILSNLGRATVCSNDLRGYSTCP